jgi:peptidoglycan/LPS O-acetylase OafA/YrhL
MSLPGQRQQRFHFIDGYRAFAVILTMLCHSIASNIEQYFIAHGWPRLGDAIESFTGSGVDLFFVISGLVLLRPYLRNERKFDTPLYFKRRLTRIYPTYFAALLFGAAVIWYINAYPTWYNEKGVSIKLSLEETLSELPLLNLDGKYYNLAWWSVQVEALFYILVPVLVYRFPHAGNFGNKKVISLVVGTMLVSAVLQLFFDNYYPWIYSYRFMTLNLSRILDYPLCFLLGMMMATRDFSRKWGYGFMIFGAILFLSHWYYWPLRHAGWGAIYGGLLMVSFESEAIQKFLSRPFFVWFGERSYSFFLVHLSVFYLSGNVTAHFTTGRGLEYGLLSRVLGYVFTLLVGMLLFQLVERRFARGLVTEQMVWPWQKNKMRRD